MAQKINIPKLSFDTDKIKSSWVATTGPVLRSKKDIDEQLGQLLTDVQEKKVYGDGKTFVDLIPSRRLKAIKDEYAVLSKDPQFDLREFVSRRFYNAAEVLRYPVFVSNNTFTPLEHIDALWPVLKRRNRLQRGSLLPLPYSYIVPGGRFNEQFYWDSYFIMLGLAAHGDWKMVENMVKNFAYQIRTYGYIPSANRSYLLSRSQPPFFSHMVRLLAQGKAQQNGRKGRAAYKKVLRDALPYLLAEYRFWMKGKSKLAVSEHRAYRRLVEVPNGGVLNRFYDNKTTPRPESLREDLQTVHDSGRKDSSRLYLHIRAAAESGWDFSARWFMDPSDIRTIHTADIVPIDLNALMYHLELTIADAYSAAFNPFGARTFSRKAQLRKRAIDTYLWDEASGFYKDYNFHVGAFTDVSSLAGVFPLYVGMASPGQAARVAKVLRRDFLYPGGLRSTLVPSGQQWDAPNGWAPLHWVAIQGLRRYGYAELADDIEARWLALNEKVYARSHKFVEKYNVENDDGLGGGGEYALQDGFGWTNGVYEALKRQFDVT